MVHVPPNKDRQDLKPHFPKDRVSSSLLDLGWVHNPLQICSLALFPGIPPISRPTPNFQAYPLLHFQATPAHKLGHISRCLWRLPASRHPFTENGPKNGNPMWMSFHKRLCHWNATQLGQIQQPTPPVCGEWGQKPPKTSGRGAEKASPFGGHRL